MAIWAISIKWKYGGHNMAWISNPGLKAQFYSRKISKFEELITDSNAKDGLQLQKLKISESLKLNQGLLI